MRMMMMMVMMIMLLLLMLVDNPASALGLSSAARLRRHGLSWQRLDSSTGNDWSTWKRQGGGIFQRRSGCIRCYLRQNPEVM